MNAYKCDTETGIMLVTIRRPCTGALSSMEACQDVRTWDVQNKCLDGRFINWKIMPRSNLYFQCVYKDEQCKEDAQKSFHEAFCLPDGMQPFETAINTRASQAKCKRELSAQKKAQEKTT